MDFFLFAISAETVTPRNVSTVARLACQLLPETRHLFFLSLLLRHHFNCSVEMQWASCTPSWGSDFIVGAGDPCRRVAGWAGSFPISRCQHCKLGSHLAAGLLECPCPSLPSPPTCSPVEPSSTVDIQRLIARVPAYSSSFHNRLPRSVINRQKPLPFYLIPLGQMRRLALPPPPETAQFASHN